MTTYEVTVPAESRTTVLDLCAEHADALARLLSYGVPRGRGRMSMEDRLAALRSDVDPT